MSISRREVLKHGLALGSLIPFSASTAWAARNGGLLDASTGEYVALYGSTAQACAMRHGFREAGWATDHRGRFDALTLNALPRGQWLAGFADDAELVLLTSVAAGRGRILALGRHGRHSHRLMNLTGGEPATLADSVDWRADLARHYARLASDSAPRRLPGRATHPRRVDENAPASEQSFLIQV